MELTVNVLRNAVGHEFFEEAWEKEYTNWCGNEDRRVKVVIPRNYTKSGKEFFRLLRGVLTHRYFAKISLEANMMYLAYMVIKRVNELEQASIKLAKKKKKKAVRPSGDAEGTVAAPSGDAEGTVDTPAGEAAGTVVEVLEFF